jgi:DNA-binding MarR family transcriptional regulator
MAAEALSEEHLDVMKALTEIGGVDCAGNCRIRKPGEIHCRSIAETLGISPTRIKEMIQELVRLDLVQRRRLDVGGKRSLTRFTISALGVKTLRIYYERLEEAGISP